MLANDVSLRNLIPGELAKGFGFFQSKPAGVLLAGGGDAGRTGRRLARGQAARRSEVELNGQPVRLAPNAGEDMTFDFGALIAHAAKTRSLGAGSIIGSGTVSNRDAGGGPGKPIAQGGAGYSCIAEVRTVETLLHGAPKTPFLKAGDIVRIEMRDAHRHSIFGAIEQTVAEA